MSMSEFRASVVTYGQIAELAGIPGQARRVAALRPSGGIRYSLASGLNANGMISSRSDSGPDKLSAACCSRRECLRFVRPNRPQALQWRPRGEVPYGQLGPQVLYGVCPSLDIPEDALQTFPIPLSVWSV